MKYYKLKRFLETGIRKHACSTARSIARNACVFQLVTTETSMYVSATISGRQSEGANKDIVGSNLSRNIIFYTIFKNYFSDWIYLPWKSLNGLFVM